MNDYDRTEQNSARENIEETPFLFRGEALALDLVNTEIMVRGKRRDLLMTPEDVVSWWRAACHHQPQKDDVRTENEGETVYDLALLHALITLRTALRGIFSALVEERTPGKEDLSVLNDVLSTGYPSLDLTEEGNLLPVYRTTDTRRGTVLLPVALSALRLIHKSDRKRLHQCDNGRCILFFYDTTRSATRRWCSLGCMDRARSARRYEQAKQEKS